MCQAETDPSDPASVAGLLVHSFLKAGGYNDCAQKLAVMLNLNLAQDLQGLTLERVCQAYLKASPVMMKDNISTSRSANVTENAVSKMDLSVSPNPEL